jgi:hypothetical protein
MAPTQIPQSLRVENVEPLIASDAPAAGELRLGLRVVRGFGVLEVHLEPGVSAFVADGLFPVVDRDLDLLAPPDKVIPDIGGPFTEPVLAAAP